MFAYGCFCFVKKTERNAKIAEKHKSSIVLVPVLLSLNTGADYAERD